MMLVEVRPIPIKLWLAAEPPQDDDRPEQQGRSVAADSSALRVLIVEDEFYIALDIQASLNALGHSSVGIAVSFDQAVTIAGRERPDIVLMDIRIAGSRDGVEAAEEISPASAYAAFLSRRIPTHTPAGAQMPSTQSVFLKSRLIRSGCATHSTGCASSPKAWRERKGWRQPRLRCDPSICKMWAQNAREAGRSELNHGVLGFSIISSRTLMLPKA